MIYPSLQQIEYYATLPESTPIPPRIYPPIQKLHIYATLPESTPPSQNIPLFSKLLATLPESTPPSQNLLPLSTTMCNTPRIYPSLPEYTPLFNNYNIIQPSQNLPLSPRMHPSFNNHMRHSQNLSIPLGIYPSLTICDIPRIYPSVTKYAPLSRTTCKCERIYNSLPELKNILGGRGRSWECRI